MCCQGYGCFLKCHEWRRGQHDFVFPAERVFDSRDVLCRAEDAWHALVQLGRLQVQDVFRYLAGGFLDKSDPLS
jgi:hypothetical protein